MTLFYENHEGCYSLCSGNASSFPPHLQSDFEFFYLDKGEICVFVQGEQYFLSEGDLLILFPNVLHSYQMTVPEEDTCNTIVIFDKSFAEKYRQMTDGWKNTPVNPVIRAANVHPNVVYALKEIIAEGLSRNDVFTPLIQLVLCRIMPLLTLAPGAENSDVDLLIRIISYASEHFREVLTLADIAQHFGVSKKYMYRIFSQIMHISFVNYINELRINHAKHLLLNTDMEVNKICGECGFESSRNFYYVFKKVMNMSPAEFRKSN